jgi:hypothetical protein
MPALSFAMFLAGKWLNRWRPDVFPAWTYLAPGMLFIILVIFHLLRFLLAPGINSDDNPGPTGKP